MIARMLALLVVLAALLVPTAATAATCAEGAPGGEWRSFSHDLANSRHQPLEDLITLETVGDLETAWVFDADATGLAGSFINITPVVADGCLYLNGEQGIYALNAETGEVVWRTPLAGAAGTPTVTGGRLYINVTPRSTAALDQASGQILWQTAWADEMPGQEIQSSPVVFNGMVLATASVGGAELNDTVRHLVRGSYGIMDAEDGALLAKGYSIPDEDMADGYSGGGLWATPAVDPVTGYAYEGTGNPFLKEHANTNAIIKIDVDPERESFGEIVGSFHGTVDSYIGDGTKPACELVPSVATCEFADLDFGASPQLFTDADGRALVGDLQKSGYYHVADADTMEGAWSTFVGPPALPVAIFLGPASTASFDGEKVVVAASYPGLMEGLDRNDGAIQWQSPLGSLVTYHAVSTAGGVAYTLDQAGILHAVDAATGASLLARPVTADIGEPVTNALASNGIAIARHTVYVPVDGYVIAYRLPSAG